MNSKMKKLVCVCLSLALVLCLSVSALGQAYTAGTYSAAARGNNGDVKVNVTFAADCIEKIEIAEHAETPGLSDPAFERIPAAIVENQSLAVDAVTGATNTSVAILAAVEDCVAQAGGDVQALKQAVIEAAQAGEAVEMTADVVIIGAGGAGVAAAVAAAEEGASVIIIDKTATGGGNTILAGGKMNAVTPELQQKKTMGESEMAEIQAVLDLEPKNETMARWQAALQEELNAYKASGADYLFDSIHLHMLQTYIDGDYVGNPALIEKLCTVAPDTYYWMESLGLEWKQDVEIVVGAIWRRSHAAQNYKSGVGFIEIFTNNIKENNYPVEFLYEVKGEEIMMDNGRAVGVKAVSAVDGTPYTLHANKGVVIATGGFAANVEMREKYNEVWAYLGETIPTTNAKCLTGDGITMATDVGANLVGMGYIQLAPIGDPITGTPSMMIGTSTNLMVNREGKRFVNETERRDVIAAAELEQTEGQMWLISDSRNVALREDNTNNYGVSLQAAMDAGICFMDDTLEGLAKQIGVDPAVLQETVDTFNECVRTGKDEQFGRAVYETNTDVVEGPFYASLNSPAVHHTMGGIEIDTDTHVISTEGTIIPGLYAAGEVTGGIHGSNRLGANAIADALAYGRIAGGMAAQAK